MVVSVRYIVRPCATTVRLALLESDLLVDERAPYRVDDYGADLLRYPRLPCYECPASLNLYGVDSLWLSLGTRNSALARVPH